MSSEILLTRAEIKFRDIFKSLFETISIELTLARWYAVTVFSPSIFMQM